MAKNNNKPMRRISSSDNPLRSIMRRSFISGVGSVIAVSGASYLPRQSSPSRDYILLAKDWRNVGGYIGKATIKFNSLPAEYKLR